MAILFVTHKFPPSIGGMQKQIYELINGVRKRSKVYTIAIRPAENKIWFLWRLKARIKSMLKQHPDIDIVHCNDGLMASFCTWLIPKRDVKLTATIHGLDIVFPNAFFQDYIIPKLRQFDRIFCVSRATADACFKRGFNPAKLQVIHNGIDTSLKDIALNKNAGIRLKNRYKVDFEKNNVILAVGRAVKRKGFSWFIREVLPDINNSHFVMIGPIKEPSSLINKVRSILPKGLTRQIELMLGYPSDSSVILVALEAVMRGCPVVAADIEGIKDAVSHHKNGILLPSSQRSVWSAEINSLLLDDDRRQALAKQALTHTTDTFSWEKMSDEYAFAFQELAYEKQTISIKDMVLV